MKKRGFTLVELMIGVALVGVIVGALVVTVSNLSKSFQKSTASAVRNEAIITAMNVMERQVERSLYVKKVSDTEVVLKVEPTATDITNGITKNYLLYFKQNPSNSSELIGYFSGQKDNGATLTPPSGSPEVIYDQLAGSGSLKFVVLATNKFYLPEIVLFPGQTKTFYFYDEYTNTFNSTTQTYSIPGILIGNYNSTLYDTQFSLYTSTLGSSDANLTLTITYQTRTGTGASPTYTPSFTNNRVETYTNMLVVGGTSGVLHETNVFKSTSGGFNSTYDDGALKVTLTNFSATEQIKLGAGSYIEVPYTMTAGKSVVVYMKGSEISSDRNKSVEITNTLSGFENTY